MSGPEQEETAEQETLRLIEHEIAQLAEADRIRVAAIASTFRNAVRAGGDPARIAFALVGAELAVE
jgi:hypothetical protein